ncbi:SCO family protein [Cupriavidus sp. H18C2]
MVTPPSASRAARRRPLPPWAVLAGVLALAGAAIHGLTDGLSAWTLDQRRAARIARQTLRLPPIDVHTHDGQRVRLFGGAGAAGAAREAATADDPPPAVYLVDFIYTRCATVCRALGAEFDQLQRQRDAVGMAGRIALVSLSFDPRDMLPDLRGYASTHHARAPGWRVAAAVAPADMARLLADADVIAIPDGLGGFAHNGGLHVVGADGTVLATYPLEDFQTAYASALAHARRGPR